MAPELGFEMCFAIGSQPKQVSNPVYIRLNHILRIGFQYNASDDSIISPTLHNLKDVQVLHFHAWTAFWSNLSAVIPSNTSLMFQTPCTHAAVGQYRKQGGQRYLLENVLEGQCSTHVSIAPLFNLATKPGFEMCFAIRAQHRQDGQVLGVSTNNKSRIQHTNIQPPFYL